MTKNIRRMSLIALFFLSTPFSFARVALINEQYHGLFQQAEIDAAKDSKKKYDPDTALCLKLPPVTRYFMYRRLMEYTLYNFMHTLINDETDVIEKFGVMAYLVCRESSGLVVTQSPHKHEKEKRANGSGMTNAALEESLLKQILLRIDTGKEYYFDDGNNGSMLQLSGDLVDDTPDKKPDPELKIHYFYIDQVKGLTQKNPESLLSRCGTVEYFDFKKEPEVISNLHESLNWMTAYMKKKDLELSEYQHGKRDRYDYWFHEQKYIYSSKKEKVILVQDNKLVFNELARFHQLNSLCPDLAFDTAKFVHGIWPGYFGPLKNSDNAISCGYTKSLCKPIFNNIAREIFNP